MQKIKRNQNFWIACILLVYGYLYFLIVAGDPFLAFDHVNYINFLNEPYPFFFEPLYTFVAYLVNWLLNEDERFAFVFIIFTIIPLLIVWYSSRGINANPNAMLAYACIVIKSFYIGFIAQRFFFAELWVAAVLISSLPKSLSLFRQSFSGLIHFSALFVIPILFWMKSNFSLKKFILALMAILPSFVYVKYFSGFELFGYSYARYLELSDVEQSFPYMTLMQMLVLAGLCFFVASESQRLNLVGLCVLTLIIKILFSDIEVFSRVIQLATDVIIVLAVLFCRRTPVFIFLYCLGFLFLQLFFVQTAGEMAMHHISAILNLLQKIGIEIHF
jgi:hypothetical protein